MNLEFGVCPRCQLEVSEDRLRESVVICNHCGFTDSKGNKKVEAVCHNRFLKWSGFLTLLMVLSFIHASNWDQHALSIIPLKAKEYSGMASVADFKEIARMCEDRKRWDCVESALDQTYRAGLDDEIEALAELGRIQYQRGKINESVNSFQLYFSRGGLSLDASYNYAKSLSAAGQVDQASQTYEQVLKAKPETLQITVVQNYVRLLMHNSRYAEAKTLIEDIREQSANAHMFMDREFQQIQQYVK